MQGFGLGLYPEHHALLLETSPRVDFLEIISENFLNSNGNSLRVLDRFRKQYPLVMHGVSLSIGSTDPLNWDYLNSLKDLATRIEPLWISDHLCWTGVNSINTHDLLPVPYTKEALNHIVDRLHIIQDFLGESILLENVSSYIAFKDPDYTEWEFLTAVAEATDCKILLDLNNIYVSSVNLKFDPIEYLMGIPVTRVKQFHLAGHTKKGNHLIDTHDSPIIDPVWDLYAKAVQRFGKVATLIERDREIPPLSELIAELDKARVIATNNY